jgi:excisionase family DNA binding protein
MDRRLLKVSDVAHELGVTCNRVYQLIKEKEIPAIKLGGMVRIPRDKWEAIVECNPDENVSLTSSDGA